MTPPDHHSQSLVLTPVRGISRLEDLPFKERTRVREWQNAFARVDTSHGQLTPCLSEIACRFDKGLSTVRRKWDEWIDSGRDWRVFADGRSLRAAGIGHTHHPSFERFVRKTILENQRSTAAAIRELKRLWKARHPIPGYEGFPGWPAIPDGWSERNLRRLAPTKAELKVKRQGMKKAATLFKQTLTTRVGLWPGAWIQYDDVWHDNLVRHGNAVTRVLEFGALDVYSAARYDWGSKPRLPRNFFKDGKKHDGLSEREFRLFAAGTLFKHGYNADQGTRLSGEGGTAKFSERFAKLLYDGTGGKVVVSDVAITGEQQAVLGLWTGRSGGNPRAKAHLESLHSLIHNELAGLLGQTGKDWKHAPEETHGIVAWQKQLIKWAADLPEHLRGSLHEPLLDYFTQFLPLRDMLYRGVINGREDHQLEGWAKIPGRIITEYTLAPGSDTWLALGDLPEETRAMIHSAVRQAPDRWSRRRAITPGEAWELGRKYLTPITQALLCDLLGEDLAVERKVDGLFFQFRDADIDPWDDVVYSSRVITPDGKPLELPHGEKFAVFSNPYHPDSLLVCDARLRCLGVAPRVNRVCAADREALEKSWGHAAERQADRLARIRSDYSEDAERATAHREADRRLIAEYREDSVSAARESERAADAEVGATRVPPVEAEDDADDDVDALFTNVFANEAGDEF